MIISSKPFLPPFGKPFLNPFGDQSAVVGPTPPFLINENFSTDPGWTQIGSSTTQNTGEIVVDFDSSVDINPAVFEIVPTQSEVWVRFDFSADVGISMPTSGDEMHGSGAEAANSRRLEVGLENDGGTIKFLTLYAVDGAAAIETIISSPAFVAGRTYDIILHHVQASAPAADDGIAQVWIDEVLVLDISGIDNDTRSVTRFLGGVATSVTSTTQTATLRIDNVKMSVTGVAP